MLPSSALEKAKSGDFDVCGYQFDAQSESTRQPRVVRVGLIQNKIVRPTTDSIPQQVSVNLLHNYQLDKKHRTACIT